MAASAQRSHHAPGAVAERFAKYGMDAREARRLESALDALEDNRPGVVKALRGGCETPDATFDCLTNAIRMILGED